jgi:hypothetical protein
VQEPNGWVKSFRHDLHADLVFEDCVSGVDHRVNRVRFPGAVASENRSSVSLSSDGNTAIVGGSGDNSGIGAAWVFTRSGGVWTQQGDKLVGSGAVVNVQLRRPSAAI